MAKIEVLNVRLPDEVLKWIDSLVKKGIYNSRSEMIRELLRDYNNVKRD
jgi:putative addiction module CopG family antidote